MNSEAKIKQALGNSLKRNPDQSGGAGNAGGLVQDDLRDVKTVGDLVQACARQL